MCNAYLQNELKLLNKGNVILALGKVAHDAVLRAYKFKLSEYPFGHAKHYKLNNGIHLLDSYHCSRYNTQTKRLTTKQFEDIFKNVTTLLNAS